MTYSSMFDSKAQTEASALCGLVKRGVDTADHVRVLIGVSATDEEFLRKFFAPAFVARLIAYRHEVRQLFDMLLRETAKDGSERRAD